jgi:hypothetical protein
MISCSVPKPEQSLDFEISDVVSSSDGNSKLRKDLDNLLLNHQPIGVPSRLLLGVSNEFAQSVRGRKLPSKELPLTMVEFKGHGTTRVFEAVRAQAAPEAPQHYEQWIKLPDTAQDLREFLQSK